MGKAATGIKGFDEITGGGLPKGRATLVCGAAGSGKTLLATEFLVRGATELGERGVFMTFEESVEDLTADVASLGFDLAALIAQKKIIIDHVRINRHEIEETGEYDLEGLFIRLDHAIKSVRAKRVVLDTIEALFAGFSNPGILRIELARLFRWLKDKGVTAVITGERGEGTLTRHGLEEYVSDAVVVLDNRVDDQVSTRRLRIVKYRGSSHGTNEYPFLIGRSGLSVLPITSLGLQHEAPLDRVSTGLEALDAMLGGKGFYRGSSILLSGPAGTGKSSLAAHFVDAACRRGERCVYFLFEESPSQYMRNMRSIGIHLEAWMKDGSLHFRAARPALLGLEQHLVAMHREIEEVRPTVVVVDPINDLMSTGTASAVKATLLRLVDYLKTSHITALFSSLTSGDAHEQTTDTGISSLMDTWILLRAVEEKGQRHRGLYVLKSRGMPHSNEFCPYRITDRGVQLIRRSPRTLKRRTR
ncbi:MAG TPA: circadian clock protein KaiC [Propionibacteriaceae bacterium]|nr:circadian clock protein KaiC [Propionibacteriaceae bacterium]